MCMHSIARVVSVDATHELAAVVFVPDRPEQPEQEVPLIALDDPGAVLPGDWLVVHLGFAVEVIDESTALELVTAPAAGGGEQS